MFYLALKTILSAVILVAVSEIAKRNSFWGALLASLPLVSVLAMVWLYVDTRNTQAVANLSTGIFWMVLPSLLLFIVLPLLLGMKWNFYIALSVSAALTALAYGGMVWVLARFGISL